MTAMFGVAVVAGQVGIDQTQHAMQWGWDEHLDGHLLVTDHAPVSHGCGAPEGGVAQVALGTDIRMGTYTTQPCTCLCIERTWIEQNATFSESESSHNQGSQNSRHETGGGEAPQGWIFHHSPISSRWHNTMPRRCG